MSTEHRVVFTHRMSGAAVISASASQTEEAEEGFSIVVDVAADSETPEVRQVAIAFTVAPIQSLCIHASHAVTFATNAADGSGGDIFEMTAGQLIAWQADDGPACPLGTNVTTVYLTNESEDDTPTVTFSVLRDA